MIFLVMFAIIVSAMTSPSLLLMFIYRCVQKVVMEEQLEWENVETCDHSYNNRCQKSQITVYNSAQEEECNEDFVKKCFIEYSKAAVNVTVDVCRTPLVKDCDKEGEEICSTQYESECVTTNEKHEVSSRVAHYCPLNIFCCFGNS